MTGMPHESAPVAFITGSATGVGRACAQRFAAAGFRVVINHPPGRDAEQAAETRALLESHGAVAVVVPCDVSSRAQLHDAARAIQGAFGRLNVLVNCAGLTHFVEHADLEAMTEDKWDAILAVNTKGPFFVIQAMLPLLRVPPTAAIVNISSVAGLSGAGSSIAYCASKGALNTMTKSLARALAPGIRVNAVCPGPINSRWLRTGLTEEQIADRIAPFPIPKLAEPSDIADTVFYLAVETGLTTGQLLTVDGGRTM